LSSKISKAVSRSGHRVISRDTLKHFVYLKSNYVQVDQNSTMSAIEVRNVKRRIEN